MSFVDAFVYDLFLVLAFEGFHHALKREISRSEMAVFWLVLSEY